MKLNYLIKAIPLLSTLLILIFFCINNQKEYTKLRILIWNTPSNTLGNYLAISTGTGFIISYFITTNLARINPTTAKTSLRFKEDEAEKQNQSNIEYGDKNSEVSSNSYYDNTLIERDVKDPSPTINASFRVIGRIERNNSDYKNYNINDSQYDSSVEFDDQLDENHENNETINQVVSISSDWNDESYSTW